jgi:hypothetical protein
MAQNGISYTEEFKDRRAAFSFNESGFIYAFA